MVVEVLSVTVNTTSVSPYTKRKVCETSTPSYDMLSVAEGG
jgi:hypothetical protein